MTHKKPDAVLWMLAACLLLAYLLPYHMFPYMVFYNDWLALFGIALLLVFLAINQASDIRLPWIIIIPSGLIGLIIIQLLIGQLTVKWDMILPVAYLTLAAIAMIAGATLSSQPEGVHRLCSTLAMIHLMAGLISCVIATLQITGQEKLISPFVLLMPPKGIIRPAANLGQPNQLALLFCLGVASVWYLYQRGQLRPLAIVASIVILLWGLALTQSRIGWLIIPIMLMFTGLWRHYITLKSISLRLSVMLTASYFVFVLIFPEIDFGVVSEGRVGSVDDRAGSISERWVLIQQAWQMSLAHPWLGVGWFEFGPQQLSMGADFSPTGYNRHAHNIVLNLAAELGWPAAFLILISLAYWFYRSCLSPMIMQSLSPEVGFAILFLTAVLIHSLVEFPLWYAYVLMPTALLMGVVHHAQLGSRNLQLPKFTLLMASVLTGAGLLTVATDYHRLVNGFLAHGWEMFGLKADEGSTERPDWTVFPHFYDYFQFTKTPAKENMTPAEIAFMERTAKRFGYPSVMMRMSIIYALNGRSEEAVRTIKTLKNLHSVHYREAYNTWNAMALYEPAKYAEVFSQMPPPGNHDRSRL